MNSIDMDENNKKPRKRNTGEVDTDKSSGQKIRIENRESEEFEDTFLDEFEDSEGSVTSSASEDAEKMDQVETEVWRPGLNTLAEDEYLEYDSTAYEMIHFIKTDFPCLSFDILADKLGNNRKKYPFTAYLVAGSQAPDGMENTINVMKTSKMYRTKYDNVEEEDMIDEDENEDENENEDDGEGKNALLEIKSIPHDGVINRLRCMPQMTNIVATMSDREVVSIYNLQAHMDSLDVPSAKKLANNSMFRYTGHSTEGFALDWSKIIPGRLATGDYSGKLQTWDISDDKWVISRDALVHDGSVEDIQWSPVEGDILASCTTERSLKIWDVRQKKCLIHETNKHRADINVISWNPHVTNLLLSGGDDGIFHIWDMQKFSEPLFSFDWHKGPITSLEWNPNDSSELAVSSEDNSVTLWNLSLTKDPNEKSDLPPQLLFLHQGQTEIKELHWHKQIPGVLISVALDGINIWKPSLQDN